MERRRKKSIMLDEVGNERRGRKRMDSMHAHTHPHSLDTKITTPVGLPGVKYLWVCNAELSSLHIQEVKQTLDGLGHDSAMGDSKYTLKQPIHIWLQNALQRKNEC